MGRRFGWEREEDQIPRWLGQPKSKAKKEAKPLVAKPPAKK